MAVSLGRFIENLTKSGLFSRAELAAFQEGLPAEKRPKDTQGLARELIRAGKLTKYQAAAVYQGKTKGLVLGEYTILDKIGAGGMGVVLKAQHRRMKRLVALKMLPAAAMKSQDAVPRFYREVEAAARLMHPNIVAAYDASEHEGIHYLVMEYVDGKDLAHTVSERGSLPVREAVNYGVQAAKGLEYAHSKGVVHRDIKPGNLLVDAEGTVKILDMGLARMFEADEAPSADRLTDSGQVMGTCDYMAPEQAEDTHAADARADIYSLGCTLYRLLTGKKPYEGDTLIKTLLAHREAPIPSLCDARPDVSAGLDKVFRRMMAKSPEDRYQSMAEVIEALEPCASSEMPVRQAASSGASEDGALTSFLQSLEAPPVVTQKKLAVAEETFKSHVDRDTGTGFARKLFPADRRQMGMYLAVGGAAAALVIMVALLFALVRGNGDHATQTSKEPEKATGQAAESLSGGGERASRAGRSRRARAGTTSARPVSGVEAQLRATLTGFWKPVSCLAFSPDGKTLVANGFGNGTVSEWDVVKAEKLRTVRPHDEIIASLAYSPNGQKVAIGTWKRATIWTRASGNMRHAYGWLRSTIESVAFSPDGRLLVTASSDKDTWLWDVESATTLWKIEDAGASYDRVRFSADGMEIMSCGWDGLVRIRDASTGQQQSELAGHEGPVRSLEVTSDGGWIVSGSDDKTVRVWDFRSGKARFVLEHPDQVFSVDISPDDAVIASGCVDGKVRLWALCDGKLLATLSDHTGPVRQVEFSSDGGTLASGGDDQTIRLWNVKVNLTRARR